MQEKLFGEIAALLYYYTSTLFDKKKINWSDEQLQPNKLMLLWSYRRDLLNDCANPDLLYYYHEGQNLFLRGDASNKGHGFTIFQLFREDLQF